MRWRKALPTVDLPPLPPLSTGDEATGADDALSAARAAAKGSVGLRRRAGELEAVFGSAQRGRQVSIRPAATGERVATMTAQFSEGFGKARALIAASAYLLDAYDRSRRDVAIRPTPSAGDEANGADDGAALPDALSAAMAAAVGSTGPQRGAEELEAVFGSAQRGPEVDIRPAAMWERVATMTALLSESFGKARALIAASVYPLDAYDRFRRDVAIRPPPRAVPAAPGGDVRVVIDASRAAPFLLRATLRSLQDQTIGGWSAQVLAPPALHGHPVGSFADVDARIAFRAIADSADLSGDGLCLLVTAGTALDPQALAWLLTAIGRCEGEAAFGDHDHGVIDADLGPLRADPWLYGARDAAMLPFVPAPAAVLATTALARSVRATPDGTDRWRRDLLAAARGRVPHVPRLIATILELPVNARGGRPMSDDEVPGRLAPVAAATAVDLPVERDDRIVIAMPTRDGADLLARAITSMRRTARNADRIDIVVVDNRSTEPATAALLTALEAQGHARRLPFNQPFNWGMASNAGARASDAPIIVFANNDLEMLSAGWDDVLAAALADPATGIVGARLLYPNRTVQHGGITFGMVPHHTEHEGRGVAADDPGPNRRLVVPRSVAGVTGAFMALRRETFDAIGGIDIVMGVAHSDIDLCLKVRELGLTIRYEPGIEAIHFESITRGVNSTKADVAWDEGERADLLDRWGQALVEDVGVSPYWSRSGTPFTTIREPSTVEIMRHIDLTGRDRPWLPLRRDTQEEAAWRPEALVGL